MKSYDSEIKAWCERKYQDVVSVFGTDNVDIHIHAYTRGNEWIVCDIFAHGDKSKVADTTFSFGDDTSLDDLYSPKIKDVVTLFELLEMLEKQFKSRIHFGMPQPTTCTTTSNSDCWDILCNQYLDSYQSIESKYDTLEIEDYMSDESVGRQVTDYRKFTNGRPLLVVFPEYDDTNDCGNEDAFALAGDVSDQLSIMINAFDKENAQEIIVEAAGEIQSLVQKYCIDRSH
ncbi:hypothetical protein K8Y78_004279 [Salmonella enterica]|nr:hypothetical protein [Salmonella enterica]EIB4317820.1 hypothetical protein [Salmonella enterica]